VGKPQIRAGLRPAEKLAQRGGVARTDMTPFAGPLPPIVREPCLPRVPALRGR